MNATWSWQRAADVLPELLAGFRYTLLATVVGTIIAAVLGLGIALAMRTANRWFSIPLRFVVELIRSTPLVVQLVFVYLVATSFSALTIGCAVLGVHYAAYMSEVYRAGIDGVPRGQWEAATALSMKRSRTWKAVILPQAIRNTLPGLGNYAISMFKETPFLFTIGVVEMFTAGEQYGSRTFVYTEAVTLVGVIFLLASYPTSLLVRRLEKRLA